MPAINPGSVVLLDTIGELASVYSLASVAFVGGSLVAAGGHNALEPAQFGVPIVMGPHYANFRAITEDLRAHDAICIVTQDELAAALIELLRDAAAAQAMGERARRVFEAQAGATARCVGAIRELLPRPATDLSVIAEVKRLKAQGVTMEAILDILRRKGFRQLQSIQILRSAFSISLAEAKRAIHDSETWRDVREAEDAELDRLFAELDKESDDSQKASF